MNQIETKEVTVVKQQATKALNAANELIIKSPEDMANATDILSKIKTVGKMIKERKEAITKPLTEALNSARDLFKPIEQNHAEAERIIKGKMLTYQAEQYQKAEADRLKIAQRVEKGTMKPETAVAKMENIQDAPTTVKGKVGTVATRTVKKVRFAALTSLPCADLNALANSGYIVWNESEARKAALAGELKTGVEVYEEKVIAAK